MTAGTLWRNLKVRSQLPNVTWKTCLEKIQVYEAKMRNCLANYSRFLVRCCKGKTLKINYRGSSLIHSISTSTKFQKVLVSSGGLKRNRQAYNMCTVHHRSTTNPDLYIQDIDRLLTSKTCSYPFLRYFCALLCKRTSYWYRYRLFCDFIQNNVQKHCTKGHEQDTKCQNESLDKTFKSICKMLSIVHITLQILK